eukprot:3941573-Rhodomonas_salina.3
MRCSVLAWPMPVPRATQCGCPVLRWARLLCIRYAMSGTEIRYVATRRVLSGTVMWLLRICYAVSGTEIGYAATRTNVRVMGQGARQGTQGAICLRARYALSGTGIAYDDTGLRACYALCGTDLAYRPTRVLYDVWF